MRDTKASPYSHRVKSLMNESCKMDLNMYKNFLPLFIILGAGLGKSLTDGATVGGHAQTRQIRYPVIGQGRQTFQQMPYPVVVQRRQPYQTANRRRVVLLTSPYSSYGQPRSSPSRSESSSGNIGLLLYLLFRDTSTSILSGLSNIVTPEPKTVIIEATTPACTVSWGSWTECNFQDKRYRNRQCPNRLETEEGECSIECMSWSTWSTCVTPSVVDEKQSRTRQCVTGFQTEQEDCYPNAVGFTSDGWYRHSNGHEYKYLPAETDYGGQSSSCSSLNSRLATVAVRSGELSGFDNTMGVPDGSRYYVGATDALVEDTWIFQDSVVLTTGGITTWSTNQPDNFGTGGEDCLNWFQTFNGRDTLGDISCATLLPAMCERPTE